MPPTTTAANANEPAGVAERRGRFLIEQREFVGEILKSFPAQPARRPDELLRVAIVDGNLVFALAPELPEQASFPTPGGGGAIKLNVMRGDADAQRAAFDFQFNALREGPGEPSATHVQIGQTPPTHLNFSVAGQTPDATAMADITAVLLQDETGQAEPPTVTLRFNRTSNVDENDPGAALQHEGRIERSAGSFAALIDAHHDDVVTAMAEAFATLRASHLLAGLTEPQLRQVLATDAPRDSAVERAAAAVLESLRKDGDAGVESARKQLAEGGVATAIAIAASDRRGWSPDLTLNVDAVLADALPLSQRQARRILASPSRLVDALYWPDAKVRLAVKSRLVGLSADGKTFDRGPLDALDAEADPYALPGPIEAIRTAVLRAK